MRHAYFGKQLSRTKNQRTSLFRIMLKDLFRHGFIKTTKVKAQAVRASADKLITKAKKSGKNSARLLYAEIPDKQTVSRIMELSATAFAKRTSGYTRLIKLGSRRGDNAEEVILSFVDEIVKTDVVQPAESITTKTAKQKTLAEAKPAPKGKTTTRTRSAQKK